MESFRDLILRAVDAYNRYRSPEATAKLISLNEKELIVDFQGSFCSTCGTFDYLEDFICELKLFRD